MARFVTPTEEQQKKAQRLLNSKSWQGTGNFTGEALDAWMKMKDGLLAHLIHIAQGKRTARLADDFTCPRSFDPVGTYAPPLLSRQWGTPEAEKWTRDAARVLWK